MKVLIALVLTLCLAPGSDAARQIARKVVPKERKLLTLSGLRPSQRGRLLNAMLGFLDDKTVLAQEMRFHFKDPGAEDYPAYIQPMEDFLNANGMLEFVPLPLWDPTTPIPAEFLAAKPRDDGKPRLPLKKRRPARFPGSRSFDPQRLCSIEDASEAAVILGRWHDFVLEDLGGVADSEESSAAPLVWLWHAYLAQAQRNWRACR